jgi:DNA-binding Xre family transcriptional regulator
MNISKYFWELNEKALRETKRIIKNPKHPRFISRIITFLSRCDQPKELFSLISKRDFLETWPKIRAYWLKLSPESDFRDWWETIYEQLLGKYKFKHKGPKGKPFTLFSNIGKTIREARIHKGLSQRELSLIIGMKQPDISIIEKGKKNITLETLSRLYKVLEIKKIDIKI